MKGVKKKTILPFSVAGIPALSPDEKVGRVEISPRDVLIFSVVLAGLLLLYHILY